MLNIGKLGADGADYYLANVATATHDYYTGEGEAPGRWLGRGLEPLGLGGVVEAETLRQVLGGRDPSDDRALLSHPRQVPGYDLTFRPPKSVSLLWGLSDGDTSLEARRAHDAAVDAAMDYLERHAAYTRRGKGGAEQVKVDGFVAAAFRHRASRAEDPLLHTHVLVANLACTPDDGKWRTLDGRQLYLHAKTAGYLYQAQLRAELTRRLGVEWEPVRNGYADIAGVPREVIDAFSRRRADIVAALDDRGHSSARAAQVATLASRPPKQPTGEGIRERWRERAAEVGFGPADLARLVGRSAPTRLDPAWVESARTRLLGPTGLTVTASTFTRRDALRAWCQQLDCGADLATVEGLADQLLDPGHGRVLALNSPDGPVRRLRRGEVIRLADGRPVPAAPFEIRYTTPELLATEQRVVADAARRDATAAVATPEAVDEAIAGRPTLSGEQTAAVRRLTRSGAGVEVVVGKAGSGKTFMLAAARDAWQTAGFHVVGAALAARAALELQAGSGIPSGTIDRLLIDLQRPEGQLTDRSVVVIDEAAMVGTRVLARVLDAASQAGAKIVLVGDHHQLPEIHTGGAFAGLVNRLPAIRLTSNRRQTRAWERDALDELRDGRVTEAVDAYDRRARIVTGETAEGARQQLVDDWWHATVEHGAEAVMVAARHADVNALNDLARRRMADAGQLSGPAVHSRGRTFQAGDRIICLRNRRQLGVLNGQRGTATATDADRRTLTFLPGGSDRPVTLAAAYLAAGHVDHGYALTAHKAQGMTCQETFVYATDAIYREWGYVSLSRGRQANRLYLPAGPDPDPPDDPTHPEAHQHDDRDPVTVLASRLRRSGQQALALDHLPEGPGIPDRDEEPPAHIRALLGARPDDADRRRVWRETAAAIETYRSRHGITAADEPLGPPPCDEVTRQAYRRITGTVAEARRRLRAPCPPRRAPERELGRELETA